VTLIRLTPADYLQVPWKNGGGVSTTIAGESLAGSAAGDWSGMVWQLGRTSILTPAPFSDLSGFERLQTVVRGQGLFLDMAGGAIDLSEPFTVARYDGGAAIVSRLAQGPVEVMNLIGRRDRVRIGMEVLRAGGSAALPLATHVVVACAGDCRVEIGGAQHALKDSESLISETAEIHVAVTAGIALVASVARL
jgi:uncharacterized protein